MFVAFLLYCLLTLHCTSTICLFLSSPTPTPAISTHRMLATTAARAAAALLNLTASDRAADAQRAALAAFAAEHANAAAARRTRLDALTQSRQSVADSTERVTQARQRVDAIEAQRQEHANSDALARADLQRHRAKAAAAETEVQSAADEAAAIESGLRHVSDGALIALTMANASIIMHFYRKIKQNSREY